MAESLTLYALGVGDSGTTIHWHTTFSLTVDGRTLMVDCPRRLDDMLAYNERCGELALDVSAYQETILTHLHFDHAEGIVELTNSKALDHGPLITLYAPTEILTYLWSNTHERGIMSAANVVGGAETLDRYFRPQPLTNPHDFADFSLSYRATQHIPNTFAYRFDFGNYLLGYSADTAYDESLIEWLAPCDLVIHEVMLPPLDTVDAMHTLHTSWANLLQLPYTFQNKTLLCHYGDNVAEYPTIGQYRYLQQNRRYRLI